MALPTHLDLQIVTPDRLVIRERVDEVQIPGSEGYFGVLPGHTPFLASLAVGEMWYRKGSEKTYVSLAYGFAEVLPDGVTILAERAERADEIDVSRAEAARARAEERLARPTSDLDYERARVALAKSLSRLQVVVPHRHQPADRRAQTGADARLRPLMSATRPLSFSWAVTTDKGLRRTSNEDSHCERSDIGLFIVADGMGGHVAGEVASREAVEAIQAFINDTASADKNRTWPFPFEPSLSLEANRLKAAFRLANRRIATAIADSSELRGMATTASAILVGAASACVAHVGDSRVYRLRAGRLEQLTCDHSWVEEQVRAGTMSATAARQHPWRNVVTRALSGGDDPEVDVTEVEPATGDRYLLCSDGLFSVVADQQIAELLGDQKAIAPGDLRLPDRRRQRRRRAGQHHRTRARGRCFITSRGSPAIAASSRVW